MKTSICIDSIYQELPFAERIQRAAADGFDYVEFWNTEGRDPSKIREMLEQTGIGLLSFNGDDKVSLIEPGGEERYLNYLSEQIQFARKAGALNLALHSNALGNDGSVLRTYDEVSDTEKLLTLFMTLSKAAELAEAFGIGLNLEPLNIYVDHVGNFLATTEMAAEITKKIGSPRLRVLYDAYHMHVNGEDMGQTLRRYLPQIGHIHIADSDGRAEPGTGSIDYHAMLKILREKQYDKTIGFEFFPARDSQSAVQAAKQLLSKF